MTPPAPPATLDAPTARTGDSLPTTLGIELTAHGADWLEGTLPLDARTRRPDGTLHGGASLALAETLATAAAERQVDPARARCHVQENAATHVRAATRGPLTGRASLVHLGRSAQVWHVEVRDADDATVTVARVTMAVIAA